MSFDNDVAPSFQDLYPSLSPEELLEAEANLGAFLEVIKQIAERVCILEGEEVYDLYLSDNFHYPQTIGDSNSFQYK